MQGCLGYFNEIISDLKRVKIYRKEEIKDKKLISFASNDYLCLSRNKKVKKSAIKAIKKDGTGGKSSKFIEGFNEYYTEIEKQMKKLKNAEDCLIFSSGYLCNIGIFSAIAGKEDIIFLDEYSHASSFTGAILSGAKIIRYKHNEISDLEKKIQKFGNSKRHIFIGTETIFSMKGTVLKNPAEYIKLAKKYNAIFITDEAHGFGVMEFDFPYYEMHLKMGTFSKAVGALGGYVCGNEILIDVIRNLAKTGIYTTALPPSVLASISTALKLISERKITSEKALSSAKLFGKLTGIEVQSQIVFLECLSNEEALSFANALAEEGFFVKAIRKPTVKKAGIRISFNNLNKKVDIQKISFKIKNLFNIKL